MKKSLRYRECIADARRVVVKIGTGVLVRESGRPDARGMQRLIGDLAAIHRAGRDVLVVTSGAVGAGMEELGMKRRPTALPDLQMAAAVGQGRLISRYHDFFSRAGCRVGQVLLTHADFHHKIGYANARRTIDNLLRNKVIPVINENDVVADEELRADLAFGDNDLLASLVVKMARADLLIILSTVDGLLERDRAGCLRRVRYLESITPATFKLVSSGKSLLSKGGMFSKLKAARSVARAGCCAVIANGRKPGALRRIISGADEGTFVLAATI
ncbi:MAG: glutamate 5-kinase [Verrucomicrobiota bacterium]|nr:glutamate 5-kinase [Verrucomicrobiota bacterium]